MAALPVPAVVVDHEFQKNPDLDAETCGLAGPLTVSNFSLLLTITNMQKGFIHQRIITICQLRC